MDSKFNSLIERFDSFVTNAEAGSGGTNVQLDRFEKLIERLEKVHFSSASGAPTAQPVSAGSASAPATN
jgi:hypothetical protein